jgi:amino-acid N-acetyltransferase
MMIRPHLAHFVVGRDGDELLGVAGLEVHAESGLLRSVCVNASARKRGLGDRLCDDVEARAAAAGVVALYLLTTTAQAYSERKGYTVVDRAAAPERIHQTVEFRSLCPSSAVCLHKRLTREAT